MACPWQKALLHSSRQNRQFPLGNDYGERIKRGDYTNDENVKKQKMSNTQGKNKLQLQLQLKHHYFSKMEL